MKIHKLKTLAPYFIDVELERKPFEVRKDDRDFAVGDLLELIEWNELHGGYPSGRRCIREITYVLPGGQFGIAKGYCVLGISRNLSASFLTPFLPPASLGE